MKRKRGQRMDRGKKGIPHRGIKENHGKKRKNRQNRQILTAFFTLCLIIIISFGISSFSSNAKAETEDTVCKYYKSIMIEKGDTLWSIASKHMNGGYEDISSYIKEVMKMNGLRDDHITEGMYLVIPYFS